MPDPHESSPAARLGRLLKEKGLYCATAESCTGSLIGAALTDIPGSSEWYRGGVISYANEAKNTPARRFRRHSSPHAEP